jgi:hypothetical protein
MNCEKIKNILAQNLGDYSLEIEVKQHLENCPDCTEYYESLKQLESGLNELPFAEITDLEFAGVREKLDEQINKHLNRTSGLYHYAIRYGTVMAATLLLVVVSLISQFGPTEVIDLNGDYQLVSNGSTDEYDAESELGNEYFNLIVDDYLYNISIGGGDLILGELNADELKYLEEHLDMGGIL